MVLKSNFYFNSQEETFFDKKSLEELNEFKPFIENSNILDTSSDNMEEKENYVKTLKKINDLDNNIILINKFTKPSIISKKSASLVQKKWECCVKKVDNENKIFTASLIDCAKKSETILGDFVFDDVSLDERNMIKEGSIFYCAIVDDIAGQQITKGGRRIYFRTLPNWKNFDFYGEN